jgi:hypothetical protein
MTSVNKSFLGVRTCNGSEKVWFRAIPSIFAVALSAREMFLSQSVVNFVPLLFSDMGRMDIIDRPIRALGRPVKNLAESNFWFHSFGKHVLDLREIVFLG